MTTRFKLTTTVLVVLVLSFLSTPLFSGEQADPFPVAGVGYGSTALTWQPKVEYGQLLLSVSAPDGTIHTKLFDRNSSPYYELSSYKDGTYTYELKVLPVLDNRQAFQRGKTEAVAALVQSGSFSVLGGRIVNPAQNEDLSTTMDVLHYDDVIITGSLCIGFDCVNGESFGYCTLKLKENNLQFCFEDTSAGSFPTNDWKIQINDTTSGGASYFTLWDTDGGRRPFTIEAGAPAHSLYVEDYGRVGLGTSIPYVELHIVDGDSPTIRLDQDGSSGWAAQRWDLCGNETNFFVRDVTNGSKLCFRIQPSTPSNTLCMRSSGNVGIHTWSPEYDLEVEDSETGGKAEIAAQRVGGATTVVRGTDTQGTFGTVSNHRLRIIANDSWRMELDVDNSLTMASGAECTAGGSWVDGSSREYKDKISQLDGSTALNAVKKLNPVTYYYKADPEELNVGFIAEDVPELVAQKDRKNLSAMNITAVLTKVVQEQQKTIEAQNKLLEELNKRIEKLEKK